MSVSKLAEAAKSVLECSPPSRPYENAQQFLKAKYAHEDYRLLVYQGSEWYRWTGSYWRVAEEGRLRKELYRYFRLAKCINNKGEWVSFDPNRYKLGDLLDALKATTHLPVTKAVPSWLGPRQKGRPQARRMVACQNGLVHVPTRRLHEHSPTYFAHHAVAFDFLPDAPRPERWHAFLTDLWEEDTEAIETLQELFGYMLSGDTRQQKLFLLVGPKRSGKGTIARVLKAMLGHHHIAGPTFDGMATNFGLMPLIGKPVAIIADARLGSRSNSSIVTERLLSISGEDTLTIDRKYREPWTGQLPTRIMMLSNELPRLTDSSGALASRFITLILTRTFYGKENLDLTRELCTELPGIFNWALDGLERLRRRGHFRQPQSSLDAIRQMEDLSSPVGAFIRDRCQKGAGFTVRCESLYAAWKLWCEMHGHKPSTTQMFGRNLHAALPGLKTPQPREGDKKRPRRYQGIRLRAEE